jgi:hypothetical protein
MKPVVAIGERPRLCLRTRRRPRIYGLFVWLLIPSLLAAACGGREPSSTATTGMTATTLAVPPGDLADAAWLTKDVIAILKQDANGRNAPSAPQFLFADPSGAHKLDVRSSSDWSRCRNDLLVTSAMRSADGRMAYLQWCDTTSDGNQFPELWAISSSGITSFIFRIPIAAEEGGQLTLNPAMTAGYFGTGSRICDGILSFDAARTEFPNIVASDGSRSFSIGENLKPRPGDCTSGQARAPDWSHDGETLAFLAATSTIGVHGFERLDAPYDLYISDLQTAATTRIPLGVIDPADLRWAPDDKTIAFVGDLHGSGRSLWILDVGNHVTRLLAQGIEGGISWSPDGRDLVALKSIDPTTADSPRTVALVSVP